MKFNTTIYISGKEISSSSSVFIIAEAGVNHGGDIEVAKQLVDVAANAGADAVKFQAFRTENLILDEIEKAPYQQRTTDNKESQSDMLRKLELKKEHYTQLKEYCDTKNIIFLITPFDEGSLVELEEIGVEAYKIASTDTTNLPFLKKVAKTGKTIFLSTGMCYMEEVKAAVTEITEHNKNLILLQCTANYPIADNEANLNVLKTYRQKFDCILGYSDHSVGIGASPYALPLGVKVVEKHFTLNKEQEGPDHSASLNPAELKEYVETIRRVELYLGKEEKEPTDSEKETRLSLQKCLVAKLPIKQGEVITENHIVAKRTGGKGISPLKYKEVINTKAKQYFAINDIIYV